ncbi:MAG TPA: glycine cleavage T C-terminal barrel domain-containing protein [Phycisphaerae bacterium]|nr:glycine cleavage T C-terminal barrel domain-containing protein [Phycisphaerae bacterium]
MTDISQSTSAAHNTVRTAGGYRRTNARGLIQVTGADRQTWLHNLTTNVINTLKPGDGNYAFAITVQGRTLFDLNVLVFAEHLWLDIDARWVEPALAHFNKYLIVEDVQLADISADWTRFEVLGPKAADCIQALGFGGNFGVMADVQHTHAAVAGADVILVKDNVGPIPRAVLYAPTASADTVASELASCAQSLGMSSIDDALFDVIRMEAGRPASLADVDDQVIPPETLQVERGISYVKGCYLGQEVIERMRSRGSMARRLIGLKVAGEKLPEHNAPIFANGKEAGRVTSACHSPALGGILALGYLKSLLVDGKHELQVATSPETTAAGEVVPLPLPAWT